MGAVVALADRDDRADYGTAVVADGRAVLFDRDLAPAARGQNSLRRSPARSRGSGGDRARTRGDRHAQNLRQFPAHGFVDIPSGQAFGAGIHEPDSPFTVG